MWKVYVLCRIHLKVCLLLHKNDDTLHVRFNQQLLFKMRVTDSCETYSIYCLDLHFFFNLRTEHQMARIRMRTRATLCLIHIIADCLPMLLCSGQGSKGLINLILSACLFFWIIRFQPNCFMSRDTLQLIYILVDYLPMLLCSGQGNEQVDKSNSFSMSPFLNVMVSVL